MTNKIKGIPVWEGCNCKNNRLREEYLCCETEETEINNEIKKLEKRKKEIKECYAFLNKEEVCNILSYVRSYKRKLSEFEIDTLLCHCQNKLNGNLNSTFIKFENPGEVQK